MIAFIIVLTYFLGAFVTLYFCGRFDAEELTPLVVIWPIFLLVIPLMWLGNKAYALGEKHSG
jgi:hypothetical protein